MLFRLKMTSKWGRGIKIDPTSIKHFAFLIAACWLKSFSLFKHRVQLLKNSDITLGCCWCNYCSFKLEINVILVALGGTMALSETFILKGHNESDELRALD